MPQAGDPKAVLRKAKEHRASLSTGRKDWPETWVVFDRDEHAHWRNAIEDARQSKVHVAVSNPCIELWALLLHREQSAPLHRTDAQKALTKVHAGYDHNSGARLDAEIAFPALAQAHARSETLRVRAREAGDSFGNPVTYFDLLLARLERIAVPGDLDKGSADAPCLCPSCSPIV